MSPRTGNGWARDPITGVAYRDGIRFRAEHPCGATDCTRPRRKGLPLCPAHWRQVPEDLKARLRWARDEGATELAAARRACIGAVG